MNINELKDKVNSIDCSNYEKQKCNEVVVNWEKIEDLALKYSGFKSKSRIACQTGQFFAIAGAMLSNDELTSICVDNEINRETKKFNDWKSNTKKEIDNKIEDLDSIYLEDIDFRKQELIEECNYLQRNLNSANITLSNLETDIKQARNTKTNLLLDISSLEEKIRKEKKEIEELKDEFVDSVFEEISDPRIKQAEAYIKLQEKRGIHYSPKQIAWITTSIIANGVVPLSDKEKSKRYQEYTLKIHEGLKDIGIKTGNTRNWNKLIEKANKKGWHVTTIKEYIEDGRFEIVKMF